MPPGLYRGVVTLEVAGATGPLPEPASAPLGLAAALGLTLLMAAAAVPLTRET
ncbi:hypothetical protein [Streptomyces sp. NPDC018693]|uniref:hypothetical protein n=1 Tax=unclassified Streptomyces TaxID=2593676 RepID=UPI0037AB7991